MKKIIQLAILTSVSAQAATVWQTAPNALASASWDTWEYATGPEQTGSGSQGLGTVNIWNDYYIE
jgi:hypothetical protein